MWKTRPGKKENSALGIKVYNARIFRAKIAYKYCFFFIVVWKNRLILRKESVYLGFRKNENIVFYHEGLYKFW